MAGYVRTLIKSQPLVPFFCHCVSSTLGCDTARLSTVCIPRRLFPRCSFTASGRHLRASRFTTSRETFGALCPSGIKYSFRWLHIARGQKHFIIIRVFFILTCPTARYQVLRGFCPRRRFQERISRSRMSVFSATPPFLVVSCRGDLSANLFAVTTTASN